MSTSPDSFAPAIGTLIAQPAQHSFSRQARRFAVVGATSTAAYLALYVALRSECGNMAANTIGLLVTALGNTAANRRFTFGLSGAQGRSKQHVQALLIFALAIVLTSGALAALRGLDAQAPRAAELSVLVAANLVATAVRFLALRAWVFVSRAA